jgi:hypothetical protein
MAVHQSELEATLVDLPVVPEELALGVVHLPEVELALVPAVLGGEFALRLLAALEPPLELAPGAGVEEFALAVHLAAVESAVVDLTVGPVEESAAVLEAGEPIAVVVAVVAEGLLPLPLRPVLHPVPLVGGLVDRRHELALPLELAVDERPAVVGAVGEDHQPVGALGRPVDELAGEVHPRFGDHLAPAVLLPVLPPAAVEDGGSRHHLVQREHLRRFRALRKF